MNMRIKRKRSDNTILWLISTMLVLFVLAGGMYYINSCCDNGQLLEECDISFIAITFTNKNEILFRKGIQ